MIKDRVNKNMNDQFCPTIRRREEDPNCEETLVKKQKRDSSGIDRSGNTIYLAGLDSIENRPDHCLSFIQLFNEVLSPNGSVNAKAILLVSMTYEEDLLKPLRRSEAKICLVASKKINGDYRNSRNFEFIRKTVPNGYFHPKLFIIKFARFLRVVIGSANLTISQWKDPAQVIWFQDFGYGNNHGSFYTELTNFVGIILGDYDLKEKLSIDLSFYAFSKASVELVASIDGVHDADINKYGQGRMRSLLKQYRESFTSYTYQSASIGDLHPKILEDFDISFTNSETPNREIVYPSEQSIQDQELTKKNLYFPSEFYEKINFPKDSLRDIGFPRKFPEICGHICHSKVLISHDDGMVDRAIVYVGSHNCSAAAWGRFENQKIIIKNIEIGVLFIKKSPVLLKEIIKRMPFRFPPPNYPENSRPWLHYEHDGELSD